ncbi:MAG: tryptophan--tRNA ligase [Holosporales bacterium]
MSLVFSGIQPTGNLHLGNYLGAVRQWVALQQQHPCLFCIVDLHAITVSQNPAGLRRSVLETAAAFLASGIDPEKTPIYVQSQVPQHTELAWILSCFTPLGWLNRMTQFKEKAGKDKENAVLGLYSYPVLMAADILLYQATHVPVGEDQKQHLELARDIAGVVNRHYDAPLLTIPEPLIPAAAARIMSLRDGTKKMSKSDASDYSRIHLTDSADTLRLKIQKAKTDPLPLPGSVEELKNRPEALNLLTIASTLRNEPLANTVHHFAGQAFSAFKPILADLLIDHLTPVRERMQALLAEPEQLKSILEAGRHIATARADTTIKKIRETIGLSSR